MFLSMNLSNEQNFYDAFSELNFLSISKCQFAIGLLKSAISTNEYVFVKLTMKYVFFNLCLMETLESVVETQLIFNYVSLYPKA